MNYKLTEEQKHLKKGFEDVAEKLGYEIKTIQLSHGDMKYAEEVSEFCDKIEKAQKAAENSKLRFKQDSIDNLVD